MASSAVSASASEKAAALAKVDALVAEMQAVDGHVVQGCEKVLTLLKGIGMTYRATLLPRQVGVHPDNRDGYGLNSEDVHGLGQDILRMGWSWEQVEGAICVEEAPGSTVFEDFNKALADGSSKLAPVEVGSVKYASLSCSHTNAFLRALAAGVSSDCEIMSEGGKLCLRKVESIDPELASAATKGLHWLVLTNEVSVRFPALAGLLQQAKNAPGHAARLESEVQIMLKMQQLASAEQLRIGTSANWERIQKMVMRSKPPCYADGPELMQFVVICAGGVDGELLQDLGRFHRECVNTEARTIRGPFFQQVATWNVKADLPWLKIAIMKAQYTCPASRVIKKECVWISSVDLASAAKKNRLGDLVEAEKALANMRKALDGDKWNALPTVSQVGLLAKLDTMVARWALAKQKESAVKVASAKEVCSIVAKAALDLGVDSADLESMRAPTYAKASAVAPASSSKTNEPLGIRLHEVGTKDAATTLRQHNMNIGSKVSADSGVNVF